MGLFYLVITMEYEMKKALCFFNEALGIDSKELASELERGSIVVFPKSPVALPSEDDLIFMRTELPKLLKRKNISYYPETGKLRGLKGTEDDVVERVNRILIKVNGDIAKFLQENIPQLTENWTIGTCSFRPLEEKDRNLKAHASNELVHIDAGAYGATNGDRILRFFINVNPHEDRVWASQGSFLDVFKRHGDKAVLGYMNAGPRYLSKSFLDHLRTGLVRLLSLGIPSLKIIDSSPYDRVMRKFHNYMKDTPDFQKDRNNYEEYNFPPLSAWMVYTDGVSHACLSGQYVFVQTALVPLKNAQLPELAPLNILRKAAEVAG
jgi:hypothetical protein